ARTGPRAPPARRADRDPAASLVARAVHEQRGRAPGRHLVAAGEPEDAGQEGDRGTDGVPDERALLAAAITPDLDLVEGALGGHGLLGPDGVGGIRLARGELLGGPQPR